MEHYYPYFFIAIFLVIFTIFFWKDMPDIDQPKISDKFIRYGGRPIWITSVMCIFGTFIDMDRQRNELWMYFYTFVSNYILIVILIALYIYAKKLIKKYASSK